MWWLVRKQPIRVLRGSLIGTAWMVGLSARPYLVSRAVDDGLRKHDTTALLLWCAAILLAGAALAWLGIMRHRTMTFIREDATARSAGLLVRHLAKVGAVLPRKMAAGEIATIGGSDIGHTSAVLTLTGPGVGAVLAYAAVAVMLWSVSVKLALVVLIGVPAIAGLIGPLLKRLERTESAYRKKQGMLTARAGDIVAGLRVLAGVGGRDLFARRYDKRSQDLRAEGYRVGQVAAWIEALMVVIPGLFLAIVVWLSARMTASGEITIGQMVAVYGYVAILVVPVWFLIEGGYLLIRGRVAARRVIAVLNVAPDDVGGGSLPAPDYAADLHDPQTSLVVRHGALIGVACDDPAEGVALADRLGRFAPSDVTWGGVPLSQFALDEVRSRILVADHDSYVFAGSLREILLGKPDALIDAALHTASARDVVDSLPDGLDTDIDNRARRLSGGQRQRVRLTRALLAEPEVLILIDPTSAVDAHTEARIGQRLRAGRAGRTTVVVATSSLLLGCVDTVAYVSEGQVAAIGTHDDLLDSQPGYRALVSRDSLIGPESEVLR